MDTMANKQLLQDIYAQISRGNLQPLLDSMANDIQWTIIGSTALGGSSWLGTDSTPVRLSVMTLAVAEKSGRVSRGAFSS